jgi:hypothetical protein
VENPQVRCIAEYSHVRVAPVMRGGGCTGSVSTRQAAIVSDTTLVHALEACRYGLVYRPICLVNAISRGLRRRPAPESVTTEIAAAPAAASRFAA